MADTAIGTYMIPEQFMTDECTSWGLALQQEFSEVARLGIPVTGINGQDYKYTEEGTVELEATPAFNSSGTTNAARNRFMEIELEEQKSDSTFVLRQERYRYLGAEYTDAMQLGGVQSIITSKVKSLTYAAARAMEKIVLGVDLDAVSTSALYGKPIISTTGENAKNGGIFGVAKRGTKVGTATSNYLSGTASIAASWGASTSGSNTTMNVKKMLRARTLLKENHLLGGGIGKGPEIYALVTPEMIEQLISDDTRLGSKEYGFKALQNGEVENIAGIKFIQTNNLPYTNIGTTSSPVYARRAVVFSPRRLLIGHWNEMKVEIAKRDDLHKTFQVGGWGAWGCARLDEDTFITIDALTEGVS